MSSEVVIVLRAFRIVKFTFGFPMSSILCRVQKPKVVIGFTRKAKLPSSEP